MQDFLEKVKNFFTLESLWDNFVLLTWINPEWPNAFWLRVALHFAQFCLLLYLFRHIIRYFYRRKKFRKGHFVHLRITLPKNDSKLDNEKRTEKDFHEAIGRAEQFFRSLHETRDLNMSHILYKRFLWGCPQLSFELQIENQQLSFVIVCDQYYQKIIEKQVTSFYESAEIEPVIPEKRFEISGEGLYTNGFYMYTSQAPWFPIQTYKDIEDDALNSVANAFSGLQKGEKGCVQLVVHPMSNSWQIKAKKMGTLMFKGKMRGKGTGEFSVPLVGPILRGIWFPIKVLIRGYDPAVDGGSNAPGASGGDSYVRMLQSQEEIAKKVGEKANRAGFKCVVRVFASAPQKSRVEEILNGIFVSFNVFRGKGMNRFENRRIFPLNVINSPIIQHNFRYRLNSFCEKSSLLTEDELGTMFHFPDAKYNKIPTIRWLEYKVLPAPLEMPKEGIVLGENIYRGKTTPVRILRDDRTRHFYIIGKSGSGKSVLLWNMAIQDIANGDGVCVVDPHGDLVEDVAACVPKHRAKDVIIFNPGDKERPLGLNLLETKSRDQWDRASLDAMEIFIKLFGNEIFGPRIQHYFRNACLTLMEDQEEGATLIDVPRMFIDEDFQRYKVSKVTNPVVRSFWEGEIANTGQREKQEMIPYFTSKFGPFVTNTVMRNIIGQTKSAFDIRECMDNQKILLINLSKGTIGAINSQLLGMIVVSKINMGAMGRADMAKKDRKDFYLYVDEFQNFATDTFAGILSEARKYRLNLIMAHQYIAQLSEGPGGISIGQKDSKIKDAVFGNVGSMASFKVGAEDAEYLEKEYAPLLSQQDIAGIAKYKAYMKLNIDNTTSRVFSMNTLYDPDLKNDKVLEVMKKYSRMKYGRKKEFVDAEIEARMGIDNLNQITESAKADPTVHDELLTEDPNTGNDIQEVQEKAIYAPEATKKDAPQDSINNIVSKETVEQKEKQLDTESQPTKPAFQSAPNLEEITQKAKQNKTAEENKALADQQERLKKMDVPATIPETSPLQKQNPQTSKPENPTPPPPSLNQK
jgi:type IV secretory pathway TraG/TraD family ATPase VirD4